MSGDSSLSRRPAFVQFPNFAPVSLVVRAFFGVVGMLMAASLRERLLKLAAAIVLGAAAAATFAGLVFGLYGFAKPTFFWYEFFPRPERCAICRSSSLIIRAGRDGSCTAFRSLA